MDLYKPSLHLCLFGAVWHTAGTFYIIISSIIKYPPSLDKSSESGLLYLGIIWIGLTIPFSFLGAVGAKLAPQNLPLSVMLQVGVGGGIFYVFFITTKPGDPLSWFLIGLSIVIFISSGLLTWFKGVQSNR